MFYKAIDFFLQMCYNQSMKNTKLSSKDVYNFINPSDLKDISVIEAAYRKKHPEVSKQPMAKSYFALHLILRGEGKLVTPNGEYPLKKNDIFVRFPNEVITYYDYDETPFRYIFVTFTGATVISYFKRLGITPSNRIFKTSEDLTKLFKYLVLKTCEYPEVNDIFAAGCMHLIFADLAKQSASLPKVKYDVKESYVLNAINFIQINLSNRELDADYVAQYLNLNTDYFLRIFKNVMGTAFSKYIVAKRMSLAISLMDDGKMSIREIALQCGYEDASYFTKSFRLAYNQSPTEYIKKHIDHIRKNTKASDKD